MKNLIRIILTILTLCNSAIAQKNNRDTAVLKANHFAVGYNINEFGHDFGLGINFTSPYFAGKTMAIKASENYQWLNHLDKGGKYTWTGYHLVRLGVVSGGFILNSKTIRVYGEGGSILLISPKGISSNTLHFGGYGLFGFEFFITSGFNYFIELGGIGSGASAENLPESPIYSNGFMSSVGFRIYF